MTFDVVNPVWPPKPRVVGSIPASRTSQLFDAIQIDVLGIFVEQSNRHLRRQAQKGPIVTPKI